MEAIGKIYDFSGLEHGSYESSTGSMVSFHHPLPASGKDSGRDVLILLHGWLNQATCGVTVQLPGYGHSTPPPQPPATTNSPTAPPSPSPSTPPSPLRPRALPISHDRDARVLHRLTVSRSLFRDLPTAGLIIADIVPTIEQIPPPSPTPSPAAAIPTGGFLPNVGATSRGRAWWEASARECRAAATEDCAARVEDRKAGRTSDVPTLGLYSARGVGGSWWTCRPSGRGGSRRGQGWRVKGVEDGDGHFFMEEGRRIWRMI
ncbi:hypothetical protein MMC15_000200 [Xylographa vitiligo]|nr:hypothetical protein [Xylographa vitiligo]